MLLFLLYFRQAVYSDLFGRENNTVVYGEIQ